MFEPGSRFPPKGHLRRIRRYRENLQLFLGNHKDVFEQISSRLNQIQRDLFYVSANLAGLICKKSADLLFGESPLITSGGKEEDGAQQAIERIVEENELKISGYESALGNAFRGDSFFKIRYGTQYGGEEEQARVFIDAQNPEFVFPEAHPMDCSRILAFHLAYPVHHTLYVESHYAGKIISRRFSVAPVQTDIHGQVTEWKIGAELAKEVIETGVPFPLVVHIPNYSLDHTWEGIDDLSELRPLLAELNHRLSLIASILDKHSDPSMAVPAGSLSEGEDGIPVFHVGRDKVFEMTSKEEVLPTYITWNGELQSCFESIRTLLDLIFTVAEIPAVALGKDNSGTSGATGLSIKFRMQSLLSKINRKRQYYEKGLKEMVYLAQCLEKAQMHATYPATRPHIAFKDGLPDDAYEQAQIYSLATGGKPTISQYSAIKTLYGFTDEQTQAELARLQQEESAEVSNYRQTPAAPYEE